MSVGMRASFSAVAWVLATSVVVAWGCGGDDATSSTATSATSSSSDTTSTTSGSGGAGGESATVTSSATTSTTGTGGSGQGGGSTGVGGGPSGEHLVISELAAAPGVAEFVEIWNPTGADVDLTDYYLSDNGTYYSIAQGAAWNPITDNVGTDFLARFPAGTTLAPDAVLVIATDPGYEGQYGACPDFILAAADLACFNGGTAKAMVKPTGGDVGSAPGSMISNAREMLVLFTWDGDTSNPLQDVDYVTWGDTWEVGTRVDKTGVAGYQADTAGDNQLAATVPSTGAAIERCSMGTELDEKAAGGNGITGHDETSENLYWSFRLQVAPTPGEKNPCLP